MYDNSTIEMNYNKLQTDFKAEAVAVNLLKYHRSVSNIFIERIGINDRAYLKAIKSISSHYLGFDEEVLNIKTYREGIYDYLPEGLFHPPSLNTSRKNVESVVKEIRKQKRVEEDARKFFRPFELEIFFTEISALLKEYDFDLASETDSLLHIFSELWPIIKMLDKQNAYIFLHILPFFHNIRGDKRWFERCMTAFLKVPVEITFTPNEIDRMKEDDSSILLGNSRLGVTYIARAQPDRRRKLYSGKSFSESFASFVRLLPSCFCRYRRKFYHRKKRLFFCAGRRPKKCKQARLFYVSVKYFNYIYNSSIKLNIKRNQWKFLQ